MSIDDETIARFWARVNKTETCWNWNGPTDRYGRGMLGLMGTCMNSRRASYVIANGRPPDGEVGVGCGNRLCVNPAHLIVSPSRRGYTPEQRFWRHVRIGAPTECWEWTGKLVGGYGRFSAKGIVPTGTIKAHRMSYRLHFGTLPDDLLVCHRCDNRKCVNPNHLFLGTGLDNMRDAAAKNRSGGKKLSVSDVMEIRNAVEYRGLRITLARRFGVTTETIRCIRAGITRKDLILPSTAPSYGIATT